MVVVEVQLYAIYNSDSLIVHGLNINNTSMKLSINETKGFWP